MEGTQTAGQRRRRERGRSADCGPRGRACTKRLQGVGSHPRRTRRDGCCHQGRQGCRWQASDHMGDRMMAKPDTPFPRHWLYYIALKILLLAGAVALVLKLYGMW